MHPTLTTWQFLASNPKSAYRQLFVKGTRIPARTLYGLHASDEALSPEEIAADYGVPVEAVREAIAYCESAPPELLEDYQRDDALAQATGMDAASYKQNPSPKLVTPQELARINRG